MRQITLLSSLLLALFFPSCNDEYDDTDLWNAVNDHEERLAALEAWQAQVNNNIAALQELLNTNDMITSVSPVTMGDETIGYTINFLHSEPITIYNGVKGEQGETGDTPQIGLTQGDDGNWYWTLNGELMCDANGNPIRANGEDGKDGQDGADGENGEDGAPGTPGRPGADGDDAPTPQISLGSSITAGTIKPDGEEKVNDAWYLSVDDGKTWYRVSGSDSDGFFASVEESEDGLYYTFTLTGGGGSFDVPVYQGVSITFEDIEDLSQPVWVDNNRTIAFEVEGLEGDAIVTALVSGEGWKASLSGSTITVTTGEGADESANLVVIATDNKGNSVSYTLRLIHAAYDAESNTYTVYGVAGLQAWGEAANQNLQSNCILAADIILPIPADGESNWTPVGRAGWMYQGTFDGAGHTISNLVVRNQDYGGLIGILETDGTVKNLVLEGASVTGNRSGIVGHNRGRVVGCGSSGQFGSSSMNLTGGIVGSNSGSIIACYSTATVSGIKSGGICGDVTSLSTQTACYWSGNAESAYGDPDEETTSTNVEKVTDNNWDTPMNTMNAKLTDYQWVKNSGGDTNLPLVLEKKESTAL